MERRRRGKGVETEREEKREEGGAMFFVGKRRGGGPSTPPPTWRLEFPNALNQNRAQQFLNFPTNSSSPIVSARKLCFKLWETLPHHHHHHHVAPLNSDDRVHRHPRRRKGTVPKQFDEPPDASFEQPKSASSLKRHVQASHRSGGRKGCALQPVSPASYSRSMEVVPNNRSANPSSAVDFKGRIGESCCHPKTSRELLKVLNHIWGLEEQHASSISVMKALKMELDLSRAQVKELLRQNQMNKQEMENLVEQIKEDKLVRKNKEHDKVKAAVQSIKEEIDDERRLRKHSESLHRKLARELSEVKSLYFGSMRDLERERKARILLENLCDDFAKGIRDYEQEVRSLRQNANKCEVKGDTSDRLILHISEAWLDERAQMKQVQSGTNDLPGRDSIVDKLGLDIETYLRSKGSIDSRRCSSHSPKELKEIQPYMLSLDSFPTKEAISAPHNMAEEDSIGTDIFEQKKTAEEGLDRLGSKPQRNDDADFHKPKKGSLNSMRKQVQSKETSSLSSEGDKVYPESVCKEDSCVHSVVTGNASSPVKLWKCESSSCKLSSRGVNDNTLMAKLLEARLEGQKSASRASKSSF